MSRNAVALAALVALAACGAPKPPAELVAAQKAERQGDDAATLAAYDRAVTACPKIFDKAQRADACAQAYTGRAQALERLGRDDDALATWLEMAKQLGEAAPDAAGRALHEAAVLELRRGHDKAAYDLFWRVILEHGDAGSAAADDALRVVVRDGRARNAKQLDGVLAQLYQRKPDGELADNLLVWRADLAEHELAQPKGALELWDLVAKRWPKGPFFDDACWNGARLARAAGDPKGALARLHRLLATKEEAIMIGSYHSVFLDDAALEAGRVLRDDLGDGKAALGEFERLEDPDFKDSILRDDALFETAVTHAALGDQAAACATFATLKRKFPESKFLSEPPAALAACPGGAKAAR